MTSDPFDNHETESVCAPSDRRVTKRIAQVGSIPYVAGSGCVPGALDSRAGGRTKLQPDHGMAANHGTYDFAMEAGGLRNKESLDSIRDTKAASRA